MLVMVDANYKLIAIDVGFYGKEGDSNIFQKSALERNIIRNDFNIPKLYQ